MNAAVIGMYTLKQNANADIAHAFTAICLTEAARY
jgi:hypothetical protein